jgi:hypothetical protein
MMSLQAQDALLLFSGQYQQLIGQRTGGIDIPDRRSHPQIPQCDE